MYISKTGVRSLHQLKPIRVNRGSITATKNHQNSYTYRLSTCKCIGKIVRIAHSTTVTTTRTLIVAYHRERVLPSITSFKNATQFMYETRFVTIGQLAENSIGSKELLDGWHSRRDKQLELHSASNAIHTTTNLSHRYDDTTCGKLPVNWQSNRVSVLG